MDLFDLVKVILKESSVEIEDDDLRIVISSVINAQDKQRLTALMAGQDDVVS